MNKYKVIGMVVGIGGWLLSLVADWAGQKELDEMIDEKVNEALANQKGEA